MGDDVDWTFDALGTRWEITTAGELSGAVRDRITAEIDRIDGVWSRFRRDSMVARMSAAGGHYAVAVPDRALLDWYRVLHDATRGVVTPLIGCTLADAGYDADYTLRVADRIRPTPRWDDVIDWDGAELVLKTPALLDVGAAGKGFAVDRVARLVARHTDRYIVDAGGDMVISPRETPVRIALEHPLDPSKAIGVVALTGGALCASASNRRAWADWHHIVNPSTASPVREVLATWVSAPDAMTADGWATALFFVSAGDLRSHVTSGDIDVDHVTVRRNGTVEHTAMPGLELFL
ncbi:FAD:protein FMN transferase [Gordonia sp. NPDC003425]